MEKVNVKVKVIEDTPYRYSEHFPYKTNAWVFGQVANAKYLVIVGSLRLQ